MSILTLTCKECGRQGTAEGERSEPDEKLKSQGWLTWYPCHCPSCECFSVLCPRVLDRHINFLSRERSEEMGTYYIAVSDACKEYIDPWFINDGGIKLGPCCFRYPGLSNLVMFRMMFEWREKGCRMIGDGNSEYDSLRESYKNVTLDAVRNYNEYAVPDMPTIPLNPDP